MSQNTYNALFNLLKTSKNKEFELILEENITESLRINNSTPSDICEFLNSRNFIVSESDSAQWRFVSVVGYLLVKISNETESEDVISVNLQKCIKSSIEFIVSIGLLPVLIPGMGIPIEKRTTHGIHYKQESLSIIQKYNRLKSLCNLFALLSKHSNVKAMIYANFLSDYLSALIQLAHAPISKPGKRSSDFVMTEELYDEFKSDQIYYKSILDEALINCFRPLLIKELLILQANKDPQPPTFMKKFISQALSNILIENDGLLSVMRCFFDCAEMDIGDKWKHVDLIKRLISVKHGSLTIDLYLHNICDQMKDTLKLVSNNDNYIMVIAACIAHLYEKYPENNSVLSVISYILEPYSDDRLNHIIDGTLILPYAEIVKSVKVLDLCFNIPKLNLPGHLLSPIIFQLFGLRMFSKSFKGILDNLLINNFTSKKCTHTEWFNAMVLKRQSEIIITSNDRSFESVDGHIQIKYHINHGNITVESAASCILEIIEEHCNLKDLSHSFFVFCLGSVMKCNMRINAKELLIHEDETHDLIDKESENLLVLMKALEKLMSIDSVMNSFKSDPKIVIDFIASLLKDCLKNDLVKNEECVMISLTLITVLLSQRTNNDILKVTVKPILSDISDIGNKSVNDDVKMLCKEINRLVSDTKTSSLPKTSSEFQKAVSEICDPLLPVRAHGLMHLTKLIETKDPETISKKHYVQCIFEENLKSDDSYIYLSAVNGLASMANYSAEDILEVLTREFLDNKKELKSTSEEVNEASLVRMKIGEVLVKITKNLGEMAGTHKALLLNTFLCGCKDSDDLVRASSLSNLAEVSRVLSYKLSSVLYEMLNCINSILETDPSPECRRAAVLVVSSLLKGLGKDTLIFLKEALLPIYRTLKKIYRDESEDSVVRLHAQIGLEELNSIVKDFIFAPIEMQKKIFILDRPE